jgi:hypothetical protein
MTVTLSKELEAEVKERMTAFGFSRPEEVIEIALRRWAGDEMVEALDPEWLEAELLKGVQSPRRPWDAVEFEALRERLRGKYGGK